MISNMSMHPKAAVLLAVLVVSLLLTTLTRNALWHDNVSIMIDASHKSPMKARTRFNTGMALKQAGRLDEAIAEYTKAAALFPGFVEAFMNRGNIYDDRGETIRALADYDRAIAINPAHPVARYNRAIVYEKLRRWGDAIADYRVSCEQNIPAGCDALNRVKSFSTRE